MIKNKYAVLGWLVAVILLGLGGYYYFISNDRLLETEAVHKELRDYDRLTHVNLIVSAIEMYRNDNDGELPAELSSTSRSICRSDGMYECGALLDLSKLIDVYLVAIPSDPLADPSANTYYEASINEEGVITVAASLAEIETVSASRPLDE